jgi:hypothetical protein
MLTAETELYIVHRHIWKAAGLKEWSDRVESGVLCIGCLEKRIGRRLNRDDFDYDHVFNDPKLPGTRRRFERLTGHETIEGLEDLPDSPPPASRLDLAFQAAFGKQWSAP